MLDILDAHLSDAATAEVKDAIERAHQVFERIELPDWERRYEELLALDDTQDASMTVQAVVLLTRALQDEILAQHMVKLSADADMDTCTHFIEALMLLPEYEDRATIQRTLLLEVSSEEIMAELCALVTPIAVDNWMVVIEEVSNTTIVALRELAKEIVSTQGSGMTNGQMRSQRIDALVRLASFSTNLLPGAAPTAGTSSFKVVQLINSGLDIGYPFKVYADRIGHDFEALKPLEAANELLAMCLVSEDGFDDPITMIKSTLESFISSPDAATKVLVHVTDLVVKMQQGQGASKELRPGVTKVPQ
jgi:hypothetical protein